MFSDTREIKTFQKFIEFNENLSNLYIAFNSTKKLLIEGYINVFTILTILNK